MTSAANEERELVTREVTVMLYDRGIRSVESQAAAAVEEEEEAGCETEKSKKSLLYVFGSAKEEDVVVVVEEEEEKVKPLKVGTAVWYYPPTHAGGGGGGTLNAFSRYAADLGDNFDTCGNQLKLRVENQTFGLGKVCCERKELQVLLQKLLTDPHSAIAAYYAMHINSKWLSVYEKGVLEEVRKDVMLLAPMSDEACDALALKEAWRPLFEGLLHKGLDDTLAACGKIVTEKSVPLSDPVYVLLPEMAAALEEMKCSNKEVVLKKSAEESLAEFCRIKGMLVDSLQQLNPKVAKMGLGRGVLFSVMGEQWEGRGTRLHMWSVFFTRTFLLCNDAECAYSFYMFNAFGERDEISKHDALWAILNKPQDPVIKKAGGGALCDLGSTDALIARACAERIEGVMLRTAGWLSAGAAATQEAVADYGSRKLLGVANGWVSAWLKYHVQAEKEGSAPQMLPLSDFMGEELVVEMLAAREYLVSAGWESEFNRLCPLLRDGSKANSIFDVPKLPERYADLMRTATLEDCGCFLKGVTDGLVALASVVVSIADSGVEQVSTVSIQVETHVDTVSTQVDTGTLDTHDTGTLDTHDCDTLDTHNCDKVETHDCDTLEQLDTMEDIAAAAASLAAGVQMTAALQLDSPPTSIMEVQDYEMPKKRGRSDDKTEEAAAIVQENHEDGCDRSTRRSLSSA